MKTTHKHTLLLGLSVLLGALIWFLSPLLTGHREPWDAEPPYYYLSALVAAGFLPGCLSARRFWLWAVGAWIGQVAAFVFLIARSGNLWPVGLLLLCFYALLSLAGAALGAGVHLLFRRLFSRSTNVA